jgi:protein involved in polysaccharide export with SLBB domain
MRFLLLVSLFCLSLFSAELTPTQLQLIQSGGYTQEDINKALSLTSKEQVDINIAQIENTKKTQIVENTIVPEPKPEVKSIENERYASQFFKNKNNIDPYSIPTPQNYILNYADKLSINIFGGQNQKFNLAINKDGNITILK